MKRKLNKIFVLFVTKRQTRNFRSVTSAGWQVTLCDPMWHVSSRSGVATLRTAIHLLLTYLQMRHCETISK